ncbi:MAG: VOC family protein [Microvirga sp.]
MRLNQVTVTVIDLDPAWDFYCALGLVPIVDARPHYARFCCPDGENSFSLDQGEQPGRGTTVYFECDDLDGTVHRLKAAGLQFTSDPEDKRWLWREAELFDPSGNRVLLYRAGENRLNPPWRIQAASPGRKDRS